MGIDRFAPPRLDGGNPAETCIALNDKALQSISGGNGFRAVAVDEAVHALEATHNAGFVHLAYRKPREDVRYSCSCCSCCCWLLNALRRFRYSDAVVKSSDVAQHSLSRCVGCGTCVDRCPFDACRGEEDGDRQAGPRPNAMLRLRPLCEYVSVGCHCARSP